jgi:hypothetical protein
MNKTGTVTGIFVMTAFSAIAQSGPEEPHRPMVRGAIMMADSHVPHATEAGRAVAIIPAWGFDVDYYFHKRWSLAVQADIKLQSFEIEQDNVVFERTNPVAVAAVLHYHTLRHWSFFAGPGYEFERHENFYLVRAGTEYSFEVTEDFEIGLNLIYENKESVYDAWTFGIAFNKKLWQKGE